MADSDHDPSSTLEAEGRNWLPMAAGGLLVLLIVGVVTIVGLLGRSRNTNSSDPYLAKLQLSGLHMATAQNFAGGSVTYVEGTATNIGDSKITGASVQVAFKNSLGEISQKETLPLTVVVPNSPYIDYGTIDRAPLAPGQSRDFRVTLENLTLDWDGQIPQIRVVSVGH
jgi:hypothetical protein